MAGLGRGLVRLRPIVDEGAVEISRCLGLQEQVLQRRGARRREDPRIREVVIHPTELGRSKVDSSCTGVN